MLPTIQRILYATDMSENSRLAFGYAMSLAKQYKAELMVLHVIEPVNPNTYTQISGALGEGEWVRFQADFEDGMLDKLGATVREFCNQLQTTTEEAPLKEENMLIRKGISVDEILDVASQQKTDLIVMGTHGYGAFKDALMGGTARRVVRRSNVPVLVVRSTEEE